MSQAVSGSANIEKDLNELERKLVELKTRYDQYFLGLDKKEPIALREAVSGLVKKYAGVPIQNTGHKFRYGTLTSRYNTYMNYCNRILREIEEGTYRREVFKKKLQSGEMADAPKPTAQTSTKSTAAKAPAANDSMAVIFKQYVEARQTTKESVQGLTKEVLEGQLKKQMQAIKDKYQCKRVTFKVVVEDGKAKIKALPKND